MDYKSNYNKTNLLARQMYDFIKRTTDRNKIAMKDGNDTLIIKIERIKHEKPCEQTAEMFD